MQYVTLQIKKYFENAFWLTVEKGFTLFAGVVVGIYVARYLQPENYGLLSYAISFVGIFSAFSSLGMDQVLVRELAKDPARNDVLLGTGFILKLAGSLCLIGVMLIILILMDNSPVTNALIMIIAVAEIFKCLEVINYYYQSQVQSKYVVQIQLIINLLVSLMKILLVIFSASLLWFAVIVAVGSFLNAIGFLLTYRSRTGSVFSWYFDKHLAGSLMRESWPLVLYGIALHIQARIDQVMLGNMTSAYQVGQYSVALRIIEIFGFVPTILMSTFAPAVSKAKVSSANLYESRLLNFYRLMFLTFLLMAVPIYFFAERIIQFLYGIEYQAAGFLLALFAARLFFSNMGVAKSAFILNESLFKYSLVTVIIGAIASILLNYILIPAHGPVGSIAASMISFTISIFLIDLFLARTRHNLRLMLSAMASFWKLNGVH